MVFSHAGKQNRSVTADDWAKQAEATGAGEILITSIDREGMMNGYDIDLIKIVSRSINIPVIAHGGAGNPQHIIDAVKLEKLLLRPLLAFSTLPIGLQRW